MLTRFWILRIALALLCVVFAHFWGRSVAAPAARARRGSGSTSWAIRTLLSGAVLQWGAGSDVFAIAAYVVAALSWAAGYFLGKKPTEPEEDLTKKMFPPE